MKRPLGWRYRLAAYPGRCHASFRCHEWRRRFQLCRRKQLLASGCVIIAAGAMISLSVAVSPPLTLLPPRPVPVDVNGNVASQERRPIETVGAAIADKFERRWQATDDMPLMPVPARDPLEGLIGGTQIGPHDFAPSPQPDQQIPSR